MLESQSRGAGEGRPRRGRGTQDDSLAHQALMLSPPKPPEKLCSQGVQRAAWKTSPTHSGSARMDAHPTHLSESGYKGPTSTSTRHPGASLQVSQRARWPATRPLVTQLSRWSGQTPKSWMLSIHGSGLCCSPGGVQNFSCQLNLTLESPAPTVVRSWSRDWDKLSLPIPSLGNSCSLPGLLAPPLLSSRCHTCLASAGMCLPLPSTIQTVAINKR